MALLEVRGLRHRFGGVTALDGADLTVAPQQITGLIGPNGAGKTTLFNAVSGALRPQGGTVRFADCDVTGWRPDRLVDAGLSRTFQIARGLAQLTVIENLMLYGKHQPGETFSAAADRFVRTHGMGSDRPDGSGALSLSTLTAALTSAAALGRAALIASVDCNGCRSVGSRQPELHVGARGDCGKR